MISQGGIFIFIINNGWLPLNLSLSKLVKDILVFPFYCGFSNKENCGFVLDSAQEENV